MNISKSFAVMFSCVALSGWAQSATNEAVYRVPSVRIRAPQMEGWELRKQNGHAVVFAFQDQASGSDFLAMGSHFEPSWPSTESDFMSEFKKHNEALGAKGHVVSRRYEVTKEKGHSCLRAFEVSERAGIGTSGTAIRSYARTIACRKKQPSPDGLFGRFEYAGEQPSPALERLAESFFEGIQFTSE